MDNVLYILRLTQLLFGVRMVSTFNYFCPVDGNPSLATNVANHFIGNVLTDINTLQVDAVQNFSVYCWCPADIGSSATVYTSGGGTRTTQPEQRLPAYLTAGVRWQLSATQYGPRTALIKRSYTRISGLADADVINGQLAADYITSANDGWITSYLQGFTFGGDVYNAAAHVNETGEAPDWKVAIILDSMNFKLGTQNSRKN
jgi:hypothetical protein